MPAGDLGSRVMGWVGRIVLHRNERWCNILTSVCLPRVVEREGAMSAMRQPGKLDGPSLSSGYPRAACLLLVSAKNSTQHRLDTPPPRRIAGISNEDRMP